MPSVQRVAVFAGASSRGDDGYRRAVQALGTELAQRQLELVYGGARIGLMGALANAVLAAGGAVTGVIPKRLSRASHAKLTTLHVVDSMHERKALMAELADGFIAVPGGLGTLDEFLDVLTWAQLGMHRKPCGLLNVNNYYDGLVQFLQHAVGERFVRSWDCSTIFLKTEPQRLLDRMTSMRRPLPWRRLVPG